ncbi:lipase [Actinoplanes sp. NEAU-A12]|uniref:Lipase n=1 Tax=Actinoplanes sandaracinus TaxID=3045177 RepID=A0ABT6X081_9ACTN|nr:lipase [Actinoplanes sandaracinus]MDI6105415.1 lipase [Actinoplanes sandaracinus]
MPTRRTLLTTGLAAPAALALPALGPARAEAAPADGRLRVGLLPPDGPYPVGTTTLHLVDRSRPDPWVTTQPYRELAVTLTYPARPAHGHPRDGWLTPGWAADSTEVLKNMVPGGNVAAVDWAGARAHARVDAPVARPNGQPLPVLLCGLGHWASASMFRLMAEGLASRGYLVAMCEPTYETPVMFPGGRMVPHHPASNPAGDGNTEEFLAYLRRIYAARVADARFVLDGLAVLAAGGNPDAAGRALPDGLRRAPRVTRVGAFGGGVAAGLVALSLLGQEPRVTAAAMADATVTAPTAGPPVPMLPIVDSGVDGPVLVLRPQFPARGPDPLWERAWAGLRGWRRDLELVGGGEAWLTDLQWVLPQVRRGLGLPADTYVPTLGTVQPAEAVAAGRAYLAAFFDRHLRGRDGRLLDGPSRRHPAVRFVR